MDYPEMMLIVLVVFSFTEESGSTTDVFYSGEDKKTFEDAEKTCDSLNSKLLTYGEEIVRAATKCNLKSYTWISKPWIKQRGCLKINLDIAHKYKEIVYNSSSFTCATYCQLPEGKYRFIGVTNSSCFCFVNFDETKTNSIDSCESSPCPGNPIEQCTFGLYISLFEKVDVLRSDDDYNREYRQVVQHLTGKLTTYELQKGTTNYFFCSRYKADNRDTLNIYCSLNQSAYNSERTASVVTKSQEKGFPLGLALGVSGGVLATVLLLAAIYYKIRKNRPDGSSHEKQISNARKVDGNYEEEMNKRRTESGVYDHTCHFVVRNDDTGNIYDHSDNIEDVYSTTVTSKSTDTGDNVYSHAGTSKQGIDEYDSCSNVQSSLMEGNSEQI